MSSPALFREVSAGASTVLKPDWFVLTDGAAASVPALLENKTICSAEKVKIFIDHETPCGTEKHAALQKSLINFALANNCELFNGYGISYQILLNRYIKEGDVVALCGDFGSVFGVKNAVSVKLTPAEMAAAIQSGTVEVTVPEQLSVELTGELKKPASAKDAVLALFAACSELSGKHVSLCGSGLASMSESEQVAFFQMLGASGIVSASSCACASADVSLDLGSVVPMIAGPSCASAAVPASSLEGTRISAVFIGGCSAGRIEDIRLVASMVSGKRINRYVRAMVAFADTETYIKAANEGLIATIMDAGILVMNQGCSACYAKSQGMVDAKDVVLTAGSRICPNCNGEGMVPTYICSPATAVRGALAGIITTMEG